ncbi:MAG: hypothetical protein EOO01_33145 [Chitinophagaceae bacterium]|nr:MAG: hypothetical protein EOO01_33145 [Chitinophagaceae bacterium]
MRILIIIMAIMLSLASFAQPIQTDSVASKQIGQLKFLTGSWKGNGWMMMADGKKHFFDQTEKVQFKLDQTLLLIEGNGAAEGKPIHNALAIVNWNAKDNQYTFRSWLSTGRGSEFKAEMKDGKFYWYPNTNMQYIIYLNEKGQWYEFGEIKRKEEWVRFFEMTLDKE